MRNRGLEAVGRYSYSIYLWHMPVAILWHLRPVSVLGLVGDVATTVVVGTGMALVVETPVLRLRDRFFPARSQASASGVEGPVTASRQAKAGSAMARA